MSGIRIPYWDRILKYACEASKATKLGFGAIDFLIDEDQGPLIVELNARPGLSIQLANEDGLRWRLKKASGIKVKTTERAVRLAKDLFGGEIEEEIESLSGKEVIGIINEVEIFSLDKSKSIKIKAKIDTGADRTSIDEELLKQLGYEEAIDYWNSFDYGVYPSTEDARQITAERDLLIENGKIQENPMITARSIVKSGNGVTIRPVLPIKFKLEGVEINSNTTSIGRSHLEHKMIIGKKDLNQFLIDPTK